MKRIKLFAIIAAPLVFLIVSLITLKDYGVNWDEPIHYIRGQAYLRYLISGKTDYSDVTGRVSYFQNDSMNGSYYLQNDSGHPPANGILASLFNDIFYRKLGVAGDLESYHLFVVFVSFLAVLAVSLFAYEALGTFGGIIAGLIFATYPLFFAEAHFNIKDPVETAFYTLTVWTFWKSLQKGNWKWLICSSIFCGLALGTKFNILFLPFIILPYLIMRYGEKIPKVKSWFIKIPFSYKVCLILLPIIVVSIFVYLWPFLWQNPVGNIIGIIKYYKNIGTGINYQTQNFLFAKFNFYAIYWIFVATPPVVLLLSLIGVASVFIRKTLKDKTQFLWLFWFLLPAVRVTLPGTSIYGGVRQIMEYIPGMALIGALGADSLVRFLNSRIRHFKFSGLIIGLLTFVFLILPLLKYHPNENVYFNYLIGGLKGAEQKNIPSAGNSFGNAYWQAIKWLNQNAEPNSKLALIQGTGQNIPMIQLRKDIIFSNNNWSGIERKGEYLLELNIEPSSWAYPYAWEYVTEMLKPVYEIKADGVVLASIWKNDEENTKQIYKKDEKMIFPTKIEVKGNTTEVTLDGPRILTRIYLIYDTKQCSIFNAGVETSLNGLDWKNERDVIPSDQVFVSDKEKNMVSFFFSAREARMIKIIRSGGVFCRERPQVKIWTLE